LFSGQAEVVSADSMQVYRGMDIGTAKPGPDILEKLPHHLIDVRNPDEQFTAGDFVKAADRLVRLSRGGASSLSFPGELPFTSKTISSGCPRPRRETVRSGSFLRPSGPSEGLPPCTRS
jgi:tRNA dimethylallyltransferase